MDFAVVGAVEVEQASAFAVIGDLGVVADKGFLVLVRRNLLDLVFFQAVRFGVAFDVVDRTALIDDDIFLFLNIRLLLVGEVDRRVVEDLRVEVAVIKVNIGIAGDTGVADDFPAQIVHLLRLPVLLGVSVQIVADGFDFLSVDLVRGIDDVHLLQAYHRRLVFDGRRDEVIDRQLVGVGDAVPLVALEKSEGLFGVGVQFQPVMMIYAFSVFLPDVRGFGCRLHGHFTALFPS